MSIRINLKFKYEKNFTVEEEWEAVIANNGKYSAHVTHVIFFGVFGS
jgi:hypothetical protein